EAAELHGFSAGPADRDPAAGTRHPLQCRAAGVTEAGAVRAIDVAEAQFPGGDETGRTPVRWQETDVVQLLKADRERTFPGRFGDTPAEQPYIRLGANRCRDGERLFLDVVVQLEHGDVVHRLAGDHRPVPAGVRQHLGDVGFLASFDSTGRTDPQMEPARVNRRRVREGGDAVGVDSYPAVKHQLGAAEALT